MTFVHGFAFRGFRSFSSQKIATLAPLKKINLIAGQNNVGKSNVLRVIADGAGHGETTDPWDKPNMDASYRMERFRGFPIEELMDWGQIGNLREGQKDAIREFLGLPVFQLASDDEDLVWISTSPENERDVIVHELARSHPEQLYTLTRALFTSYTSDATANAKQLLGWFRNQVPEFPDVHEVSGIRAISDLDEDTPTLDGTSIKRRLSELQNPSSLNLKDKARFKEIEEFVRTVLDDPSLSIEIPHDLSTIHITQGDHTLPIEYVGTGIHEVVILAAAATVVQNSIMCIEEPEVHLHPILQRKLLRYLNEKTTNQYFIATHSAHLLDSSLGEIFHVTMENGASTIRHAKLDEHRSAICTDLGYRPSDLVQTNAVIWVEGPSDRIYLQHWIEKVAPSEFFEGIHYSIMFYGGALLSELTTQDADEVGEFIALRALNRHVAVLIDSDKKSEDADLNASKIRVRDELAGGPDKSSLSWVTAGYTIENYVPNDVLDKAIKSAHPTVPNATQPPAGQWENPLTSQRVGVKQPNKTAIAREAVKSWDDNWPLDLRKRVDEVVQFIRNANSHH